MTPKSSKLPLRRGSPSCTLSGTSSSIEYSLIPTKQTCHSTISSAPLWMVRLGIRSFCSFFSSVTESLFSNNTSLHRKLWGFLVFQKALPMVESDEAPRLLTPNFMRTWINHLSRKDRYLHKISIQIVCAVSLPSIKPPEHVLQAHDLQAFVKEHPETGLPFLTELTGERGNAQFDRLTHTTTVQSILGSMQPEGIKEYLDTIFAQVNQPPKTGQVLYSSPSHSFSQVWLDSEKSLDKSWIFEQLPALIHNSSIPKRDDWIESVLRFFAINGVTACKKSPVKLVSLLRLFFCSAFDVQRYVRSNSFVAN